MLPGGVHIAYVASMTHLYSGPDRRMSVMKVRTHDGWRKREDKIRSLTANCGRVYKLATLLFVYPTTMEFPETNHHKRLLLRKRSFGRPPGHKIDSPAYDAFVLCTLSTPLLIPLIRSSVQRKIMTHSPMMGLPIFHRPCDKVLPPNIAVLEPRPHVPPPLHHALV